MWSEERITEDLRELGLSPGANVFVQASLPAIGPMEEGAFTLLKALKAAIAPEGTVLVPAFTPELCDPAAAENAPESLEERESLREAVPCFSRSQTPASVALVGEFPEAVRRSKEALRSDHPAASFVALGGQAEYLLQNTPFHYPLGTDSPLARLHSINGWVLLIGLGHDENFALHLAEIWSNVPYIHRSVQVKDEQGEWKTMRGSPECREGFPKIEPLLGQARILRKGYVGNATAQLMRIREMVSMAVAMLQGSGKALLCDDPNCKSCVLARKFTAESTFIEGQSL